MTAELLRQRAPFQRLVGPELSCAEDVISHFGCMQSQDFAMAKWSVARRTKDLTNAQLDEAFNAGRFLRTHVLRPTWHFVLPEDLTWIMALTAPRVHRLMTGYNKVIDVTDELMNEAADIIVAALAAEAGPLTRAQLSDRLAGAGIESTGPKLAHLAIHAELLGLICSGPLAGKHHTYVLVPERVSPAPTITEDEALSRLAQTYVRGHGPSRPEDLSWWSTLTLTQSKRAFGLAGLEPCTIDGEDYWTTERIPSVEQLPRAALMPPFDECISYVRKPIATDRFPDRLPDLARGGGLVFIDGLIGGTWGRKVKAKAVEVNITVHGPLPRDLSKAIEAEAARFAGFLGLELDLNVND